LNPDSVAKHRVGRIHLHTLKFHIVAETAFGGWGFGNSSAVAGAFMAAIRSIAFLSDLVEFIRSLTFSAQVVRYAHV